MTAPLRVGLVGAGPWAQLFTAPLLAAGPACTLAAVWARRADAAGQLAAAHGTVAVATFDELLASCDAVAFAVPPDVQAELALAAARAGRALLLEKPIALDLAQAERLAEAVAAAGVVSQVVLTNRYRPTMRRFLDDAAGFGATAGRAAFVGGGATAGSPFATPWRLEHGALLDLGPHVLDALDAALGPITAIEAAGDPLGVVALSCGHDGGAVSQALLSVTTPVGPAGLVVELFGPQGQLALDTAAGDGDAQRRDIVAATATMTAELAAAVDSGVAPALDVQRGVALQRLIEAATSQLA